MYNSGNMARPTGELITAGFTTPFATAFALYAAAVNSATRPDVLNKLYRIWTNGRLDFLGRHGMPSPFDNRVSQELLLKLSGLLPENTQISAIYAGLILNVLSMMGHATSNRDSSITPKQLIAEIAATFSLAITPSLLLSMIAQLDYLKTATHLGTAEAVLTIVPNLLIMAPALLKVPSVVRGAGFVVNSAIIKPITGAVRGSINSKRRHERQKVLSARRATKETKVTPTADALPATVTVRPLQNIVSKPGRRGKLLLRTNIPPFLKR